MNIDWQARLTNKTFWLTLIPALIICAQVFAQPFGVDFDFTSLSVWALAGVNAIFTVLVILGIATDTSTEGFSDEATE